jgi:hypothetical protein
MISAAPMRMTRQAISPRLAIRTLANMRGERVAATRLLDL